MEALELREAQMFRMLGSFFGQDRVMLRMSVLAVCGGEMPHPVPEFDHIHQGFDLAQWMKKNNCLFTVLDEEDEPKLVIEFFAGFQTAIDVLEVEHQKYLPSLLNAVGVYYVTISNEEMSAVLDPRNELDFVTLLQLKLDGFIEKVED